MRYSIGSHTKTYNQTYDKWTLIITCTLIIIGLIAVYSSTSVVSPDIIEKYQKKGIYISQFDYVKKQLFTVMFGIIALFIAFKIPINYIKRLSPFILLISFILLLLVFTPLGITAGGARRWLRLWPSNFQPSELVKLSMVIFMAWYVSRSGYDKDKFFSFVIPISIMGIFQIVFLKQPDFGAAMSLGIITILMLFLSGTRIKYLFILMAVATPAVVWLVKSEPYRWKRFTAFLDPWKDPLGSGFQLIQSFIALGSGGLKGVGLGEGRQKLYFLPEVHTDFIFSSIGEEVGFIGAMVVVFLFIFLFVRGIIISNRAINPFSYYLSFGITIMIAVQAIINFAVVTGMVPTKGLPLPFISYGGSSLIVNMIAIGLLLNISSEKKSDVSANNINTHLDFKKPLQYNHPKVKYTTKWLSSYRYKKYKNQYF